MPFFRRQTKADEDGFYPTELTPDVVGENEMVTASAGGETAIISRAGGELVAFSNVCPHAAADLRDGRIRHGQVKCLEHGYTFDMRTGRATWPEGEGCHLSRYEIAVRDGLIRLRPGWKPAGGG